jgi:hypothetical protein
VCTSSAPCRQIRRALTLVQLGDLISVADGSYLGFNVEDKHGTATAPIVIQANGSAANIIPSSDRGTDNRDNIYLVDSSYVILNGLRSSGASRASVRISLSQHIIVSGGVFANNGAWGIFSDFADDLILEDNEASGSVTQHGIYVSNSSQRPIVRRNRLFGNAGSGVQINADASMGGPGITQGALIEGNLIYSNGASGGAGINLDGVHDSIIRNNVLYNNRGIGITAFIIDGAEGPRGNLIANNTIVQPSTGRVALQLAGSTGVNTVRNNIVIHLGTRAGLELVENADVSFTDSNYNVVDSLGFPDGSVLSLATVKSSSAYSHLDSNSLSATPESLFIDMAASNYDLRETAAAVDSGVNLTQVVTDYAARVRPQGLSTDIGAYEYGTLTPPPPPPPPATVPVAPSNLSAVNNRNNTANLFWLDNANNETGFQIERQKLNAKGKWSSSSFISINQVDAQTYTNNSGAGSFQYRIRARNNVGDSAWSSWAAVTVTRK